MTRYTVARDILADCQCDMEEEEDGTYVLHSEARQEIARERMERWDLAHEPAKCGHARANWQDPKYGTPGYIGEEKCEVCEQIAALERTATEQTECILHFQARVAKLTAEVVKWNPCDHSGFESVSCGICGYPDSRKLIKHLRNENERLKILCAELIGPDVKKEIE